MRPRGPAAAVLGAILALTPLLAVPTSAASTAAGSATPGAIGDAAASAPKVVIVVGPTHEVTDTYRTYANQMYAEAIKYTPNVVKVYSPNATWKNVKDAAQGASILIYLGHGSGYPRDDNAVFNPDGHDGMGLNSASNPDDYVAKYYGESYMANDIRLARNAVVILSHLCFASGNSMAGDPEPTYSVAQQRIDNFASGFIRAGARTVIADVWNSGVTHYIRSIFTTNQAMRDLWTSSPSNHDHLVPFTPIRNPAYQAVMDPNTRSSGFYRSIVGALDMPASAVVAGAAASPTSRHPATFVAPGAAQVGDTPVTLYQGPALDSSTGARLPAGEPVRVSDVVPAEDGVSDPALEVETLDGQRTGWAGATGLIPRDSAPPELWSMDGPNIVSPNFDGYLDRLDLWARFSETVTWSVKIRNGGDDVVRQQDGAGYQASISWDALTGDQAAPDGAYTWHLKANDAWGNATLDEDGGFTIANKAVPGTAVLRLEPDAASTRSASISFTLTFAGPVTGLTKADFTRTGTARCSLEKPVGGPTVYAIALTDCSTGSVTLTLASGSVFDDAGHLGPVGAIASKVTIDRSDPSTSTPRPTLTKGVQIGAGAAAGLPLDLSWTGSDTGSGIAGYDVRQSRDGAAWQRLASGTPKASLETSVAPGHTYRFMVRARDKAGNVGPWTGGDGWYPRLVQESSGELTWAGTWSTEADTDHNAGGARYATTEGATVRYTFTGRAVAWVTDLGLGGGAVEVYVDGSLVATVDTHAEATTNRFVAYSRSWTSSGRHTIQLVVVGGAGGRVEIDALEVLG